MSQAQSRRELLKTLMSGAALSALPSSASSAPLAAQAPVRPRRPARLPRADLPLQQFEPRSMLRVAETPVDKARFPVVDMHTHVTRRARVSAGVSLGEPITLNAPVDDVLALMDARNVRTMVNLTGGYGSGLVESVRTLQQPHPDRFVVFTEPAWDRTAEPGYAQWQADELGRAKAAGARGVKVLKTLGLYLREQITSGPLVAIDDQRFDPMWEACGALRTAGRDPHRRSGGVFHAGRPLQRALRGAARASRLVVSRARLPVLHGVARGAQPHVRAASEDDVRRPARRASFRGSHRGQRVPGSVPQPRGGDRRPHRASSDVSHAQAGKFFDRYQDRILFGTDTDPGAPGRRDRDVSATRCTRFTSGSSKPTTSTSTTRRRRSPRRADGASQDWVCQTTC